MLRRVLVACGLVLLFVLMLVVSLAIHLPLEVTRRVGRDALLDFVNGQIKGSLEIAEIESLHLGPVHVRDITLRDPEGRAVIEAERVHLVIDAPALLEGTLRFSHARATGGIWRLYDDGEGTPSFIHAFEPQEPSDEPPTPDALVAVVEDIHLEDFVAEGEVLGLQGLRVEDVHAHAHMLIDSRERYPLDIRVFGASGRVVAPFPFEASLDNAVVRIRDAPTLGTEAYARVSRSPNERARVNLTFRSPHPDAPPELDLHIMAEPVRAETVAEAGFDWAETFSGEVRGPVRLFGPPDDLRLRAELDTEGGHVQLRGALPASGPAEIRARTEGLLLSEVIAGAPEIELVGDIRLDAGDEAILETETEAFRYGDIQVPPIRAQVRLSENGAFVNQALVSVEGGGTLEAEGYVGFDGSIALRVDGDVRNIAREPNLQRWVPGASGSARMNADISIDPDGILDINGRWTIYNARYSIVRAQRITAAGSIRGNLEEPRVNLGLELQSVLVDTVPFGSGTGRVEGGPSIFQTSTNLRHPQRALSFDTRIELDDAINVDVPRLRISSHGETWDATLSGIHIYGSTMEFASLAMRSGRQHLTASGQWRSGPRQNDSFQFEARGVHLASLRAIVGDAMPDVEGTIDGSATLGGDLERQPNVDLDMTIADGRLVDLAGIDASILGRYRDGLLALDTGFSLPEGGTIDAHIEGTFETDTRLRDAYETAAYEAQLHFDEVGLHQFVRLTREPDTPEITGVLSGEVLFSGALDFFDAEGLISVPALTVGDFPPLSVDGEFGYETGALVARVILGDDAGELGEAEGSALLDIPALIQDPELLLPSLQASPWRLAARAAPRRFHTLPAPIAAMIPAAESLQGSATFSIRGGAYRPHADLIAQVEHVGRLDADPRCATDAAPRVSIVGSLNGDTTIVQADGFLGRERVLSAEAEARTPLNAWLSGYEEIGLPVASGSAEIHDAQFANIPGACVHLEGGFEGNLEFAGAFGDTPTMSLNVETENLRAHRLSQRDPLNGNRVRVETRTPISIGRLGVQLADGMVEANGDLEWWNGGATHIEGAIPIQWTSADPAPGLGEGDFYATGSFSNTPVSPFLLWLDQISNPRGGLHGSLTAQGPVEDPHLIGELAVSSGRFDIGALGQRLENVAASFHFEDNMVTLQGFSATDGDGWIRAAGDVTMEGLRPGRGQFDIQTNEFPIRQEGSPLAYLSGDAQLGANILAGAIDGRLRFGDFSVRLPDQTGRTTQDLAANPDICLAGTSCDRDAERPTNPYRVQVRVDSTDHITVKSEELNADLNMDLDVEYADPILAVAGEITINTGLFQVFGKSFTVERGALLFDTEHPLDPEVQLVARYFLRGSEESVTITASGRLSAPVIRFSSTVTNDRTEIIGLLISGTVRRGNDQDASQAPLDFLRSVGGGVISVVRAQLSPEMRAIVPEVNLSGNATGGTRVSVGWRLEDLLPELLRSVIQGAYIEGFANLNENEERSIGAQEGLGFILELTFPRNIVNTTSVSEPSNFSFDVTWQP